MEIKIVNIKNKMEKENPNLTPQQVPDSRMPGTNKKKVYLVLGASFLVVAALANLFWLFSGKDENDGKMVIEREESDNGPGFELPPNASPITAQSCDNFNKRSFAVMYSGSLDARSYWKNLSEADFVLEMPHRMHNEPRLMGVFQCNVPDAIGPMRSGRVDHLAVADAMGAVFVTWGKSIVTASAMNRGLADNLEVGNGTASKDGVRAGFIDPDIHFASANSAYADLGGVIKMSQDKGYSSDNLFKGFPHQADAPLDQRPDYGKLRVKFDDGNYLIEYLYDKQTNSYLRFRKDEPNIDFATGQQYAPKNIITIITKRDAWLAERNYVAEGLLDPWIGVPAEKVESNQYPNMQLGDPWFDTKFLGEAEFFLNGQHIEGTWKRDKGRGNPFQFFDSDGQPVRFVPGQIWMHVLPHEQKVSYRDKEDLEKEPSQQQDQQSPPVTNNPQD